MPSELLVRAQRMEGLHFVARAREHEIHLDYSLDPAVGAKSGATPLETLLAALAACSASTLNLLFLQQELALAVVEVTAKGTRRDEHPTVLTHIDLEFTLAGDGSDVATIEAVVAVARKQICPVWIMLGAAAEITAPCRFAEA